MAIVLTNGQFYIAHNKTGGIIKVTDINQAQDFHSLGRAISQKNKAPSKCRGYHCIDTDITPIELKPVKIVSESVEIKKKSTVKRKHYSLEQRKEIYKKSNGCCQLCGRKIHFNQMSVDHIYPISKGGSNSLDNTQAACVICNRFKADIYPDEFFDRITEIFLYQMGKRHSSTYRWKIANALIKTML